MRFRRLAIACECGRSAESFHAIGFTAEYELVIHWTCDACGRQAYLVKTLADCCKECPESGDPAMLPMFDTRFDSRAADARFLHSLGIRP